MVLFHILFFVLRIFSNILYRSSNYFFSFLIHFILFIHPFILCWFPFSFFLFFFFYFILVSFSFFLYLVPLIITSHQLHTQGIPHENRFKWTNRCTLSDKFRTHQQGCLMNDDYPKLHFITVVIPALTLRGKAMIDYWLYIIAQDIISVMEVKRRWLVNGLWRHYMSLLIRFEWREVIGQLVMGTIVTSFLRR